MGSFLANWKTTTAGAAAILGALADIATFAAQGQFTPHLPTDLTAIVTGIGLIAAADAKPLK